MRAIVYDTFGGPDVLHLRQVALPEPGPGQVRVVISAAGTNPVDAQNRQDGSWADIHPPVIPGCDASGVIDVVGPGVRRFAPGDEVFYMVDFLNNASGTYAEYHVVDAALIARKPQSLTHVEAAALPLAAGTAYETIIRRLALTRGEWVLLYGAAGGVGSLALQMAVVQGAHVIAVARMAYRILCNDVKREGVKVRSGLASWLFSYVPLHKIRYGISILGKVDLKEVAEAKERLDAAGKEISDDAIEAEIHRMHEEKRLAELKASLRASPLFQPICLLMQERQEWTGTPKQFKEMICLHFPDEFAAWYRAPYKYVDELKKITPELRVEGIEVGVPPETTLVTLTNPGRDRPLRSSQGDD
jgi:hypothetical protein